MHRTAGWAMVRMNTNGSMKQAGYGPVPREACPQQLARDAEDYSVFKHRPVAAAAIHAAGGMQSEGTRDKFEEDASDEERLAFLGNQWADILAKAVEMESGTQCGC
eukprot:6033354-Amphidinium_carterae.2